MDYEYQFVSVYFDGFLTWMSTMAWVYRPILNSSKYRHLMDISLDEYIEILRYFFTDSEYAVFRYWIITKYRILLEIECAEIENYPNIRHIIEGGIDMPLHPHLASVTDLREVFFQSLYANFFSKKLNRKISPLRRDARDVRDVYESEA